MKHESERSYVAQNEMTDDAGAWLDGSMYGRGLSGGSIGEGDDVIMAVTPSGASTSWADAFKTAAPILASAFQQKQLTKLNIARINSNQPPLSAREFSQFYQAPSAQLQLGVTADAQRFMVYAAIGLAGLVGLRALKVI